MNRPAVWAALCWIAGYALVIGGLRLSWSFVGILFAGFVAASLFLFRRQRLLREKHPAVPYRRKTGAWIHAIGWKWALSGAIAVAGYATYSLEEARNTSAVSLPPGGTAEEAAAQLTGTLATPVRVDGDRAIFYMDVRGWSWGDSVQQMERPERVYVTVRLLEQGEQSAAASLRRGDLLQVQGIARRPEPARNFGGFDFAEYLRLQHVHWTMAVKGMSGLKTAPSAGWSVAFLLRWNDTIRDGAGRRLDMLFPVSEAGYMKGLLIGLREDLDPEQFRDFSRLGLTHILAISGLHVAVFAWSVSALMGRLRATREASWKALLVTIPLYVLFTGASASVVRSGITAMTGILASSRGWRKDGLSLLGLAALVMLICSPYLLLDVGFQLSFLVTAGLIAAVPAVHKLLPVRNGPVGGSLAVAITSQLVSFPISIYYFNQFSLMSLPANLLLVPIISFAVTPLGYAALLVSYVWPWGGQGLAWLTSWINRFTFRCVEALDAFAWGRMVWPSPAFWWMGAYYAVLGVGLYVAWRRLQLKELERDGLLLVVMAGRRLRRWGAWAAAAGLALVLLGGYGYAPDRLSRSDGGTVDFLDVGQGDAAYIRTPGGVRMLIDGGGTVTFRKPGEEWKMRQDPYEVGRKTVVPLLKKRGVHRLDYILVSHEDTDHIGGLAAVLEEIPVRTLLFNGTLKTSPAAEKLFQTALAHGVRLVPVSEGDRLELDKDSLLTILNPPPEPAGAPAVKLAQEQNGETVVALLRMNGVRFLFTGDLGSDQETVLLERLGQSPKRAGDPDGSDADGSDSAAEATGVAADSAIATSAAGGGQEPLILKVGHHGSKSSTSAEWLAYWRPLLSVISVGKNNVYGHPNPAALERLEEAGAAILRTDRNGEVQISSEPGGKVKVRTKLQP